MAEAEARSTRIDLLVRERDSLVSKLQGSFMANNGNTGVDDGDDRTTAAAAPRFALNLLYSTA